MFEGTSGQVGLKRPLGVLYDLHIRTVVCLDTISAFYIQLFRMENYHLDARLLCTFTCEQCEYESSGEDRGGTG